MKKTNHVADKGVRTLGSHFITGFPGFIATELVQELFNEAVTTEIIAVVQYSQLAKAKVVAQEIEKRYEGCQIVLLDGDITLPNLDIATPDFEVIAPQIEVAWHLAAAHHIAIKREKAWKINVHGTANVNAFIALLPNLRRYMYFSTAFVAGTRSGDILEMELVRPSAFHNYWEESKFEAELLVDDLKLDVPITIVRPSMIYGHSISGETKKFDGIYYLMNMIDYFNKQRIIPQIGSKVTALHAVAVDYVVKVSAALCLIKEAEGETVHIVDSQQYKVQKVYQELVKLMTTRRTRGTLPLGIAKVLLEQPNICRAWQVAPQYIDYLDYAGHFDTTDCNRLLAGTDIPTVDLMQALPNLVKFYEGNKHLQSYYVNVDA